MAESAPDTDSHAIPVDYSPEIQVVKSSTTTLITAAGQSVPYTFTVTNEGNVTLTGVTASDPNCTSAISGPTGDTDADNKLDLSETWTYTCTHTVSQAEIDANGPASDGDLDNTVTADSAESAPDTDSHAIPVDYSPEIQVVKSSTTTLITAAGQSVPYTFTVTNEGNVTLTGVTVSDPNCTSAISGPTGDTDADNKLDLSETWTYTCTHTVSQAEIDANGPASDGDLDNTVTADIGRVRTRHRQPRHPGRLQPRDPGRQVLDHDPHHRGRPERALHVHGHQRGQRDPHRRDGQRPELHLGHQRPDR